MFSFFFGFFFRFLGCGEEMIIKSLFWLGFLSWLSGEIKGF